MSVTYKIKGLRFLRRYTAENLSPTYAAMTDAQLVADSLCEIPWKVAEKSGPAIMTTHSEKELDSNVANRELFDAALWCADHNEGMHRAYANAACYKFALPTTSGINLQSVKLRVTSDPYNANGARIAVLTSADGVIPTACATCRTGDAHAEGVAPRRAEGTGADLRWYSTSADATIELTGVTLKKYLLVFVLLENYAYSRNGYLEGCSYIAPTVEITTSSAVTGLDSSIVNDCGGAFDNSFNVVKGGVYPDKLEGLSGVETIQLQRTGDVLASRLAPEVLKGTDGVRKLDAGRFAMLLDIPTDQITCVCPLAMVDNSQKRNYIAIGGTFSGGTFEEIPGLYIYSVDRNAFVTPKSLNANPHAGVTGSVPGFLATFAADHGGFAFATSQFCGWRMSESSGFAMFFFGMDGATKTQTGSTHGTTSCVNVCIESDLEWTLGSMANMPESVDTNLITINRPTGADASLAKIYGCTREADSSHVWMTLAMYYPDVNKIILEAIQWTVTSSVSVEIGWKQSSSISVNGSITSIASGWFSQGSSVYGGDFVVGGNLTKVGSVSCTNICFINWPNVAQSPSILRPQFDVAITPNTYTKFGVFGGVDALKGSTSIVVTGDFTSLNGNTNFAKVALLTAPGTSSGGLTAVTYPDEDTVAAKFALAFNGGAILHIEKAGVVTPAHIEFDHLHPDVTDEQSAIGLRTMFAKLYQGVLSPVGIPLLGLNGARPGAFFTVRGDTIDVTAEGGEEVELPTWQLTLAKLVVPFAVPTTFRARRVKLDWTALEHATAGAKLNVWLKRDAFVTEYPAIGDPAIYDGSKKNVNGWELVGVIDAVDSTTATFDIGRLEGYVASLMFTAYVNLDSLNPSSAMTMPQGVGNADIDGVNETVDGLDSGWKPDITLLG